MYGSPNRSVRMDNFWLTGHAGRLVTPRGGKFAPPPPALWWHYRPRGTVTLSLRRLAGDYDSAVHVRRRCGLLSDCFDHLFMVALCNRETIDIFMLWFVLLSSFFFSSPNLSGRRLDVYHTLAHGVALVRI